MSSPIRVASQLRKITNFIKESIVGSRGFSLSKSDGVVRDSVTQNPIIEGEVYVYAPVPVKNGFSLTKSTLNRMLQDLSGGEAINHKEVFAYTNQILDSATPKIISALTESDKIDEVQVPGYADNENTVSVCRYNKELEVYFTSASGLRPKVVHFSPFVYAHSSTSSGMASDITIGVKTKNNRYTITNTSVTSFNEVEDLIKQAFETKVFDIIRQWIDVFS